VPNYAIIIGIDAYRTVEWRLTAAVRDALRFADWAVKRASVPEENLRLLLSPLEAPATTRPYIEATRGNITDTILEFQDGRGNDGDQLYFYYAGHGVSAAGATAGGPTEPVIIPSDVRSLRNDAALTLGFSEIIPLFANVRPATQFFFIDACRDFVLEDFQPVVGRAVGRWIPPYNEAGPRSAQHLLYATSPGQRAHENSGIRGRGIFATALLEALEGQKASALSWSSSQLSYELRFGTLVPYVRKQVETAVRNLAPRDWHRFVQVPEPETLGGEANPLLTTFASEEVGKLTVRVTVGPSKARKTCRVQVRQYLQGGVREVEVVGEGPPAPDPARFEVHPGDYSIVAEAEQYVVARSACDLYESKSIDLMLQELPKPTSSDKAAPQRNELDPLEASSKEPRVVQRATLRVYSSDPTVFVVVRDAERQVKGSGQLNLFLNPVQPGIYRVQMLLPEGSASEEVIEVLPGQDKEYVLSSPAPVIGIEHLQMLDALGIHSDAEGYLRPSELLSGIANARLASLLGFAAFAAQWPEKNDFQRLRKFGVTPSKDVMPEGSSLLVLLGASGNQPLPDTSVAEFLRRARLVVRDIQGEVLDHGSFDVLPGFAAAAQHQTNIQPGSRSVQLHLPGLALTRYAVACLPNRVTVLIIGAEEDGRFDVQQYILPIPHLPRPSHIDGYIRNDPISIRRLETAQRYYATSGKLPDQEIKELLDGKWLDPLLGCIAGYALVREGNQQRFIGFVEPGVPPDEPERSALRNMLKFFNELPDTHILAGLCEPDRRAEHFTNALQRGMPVFAEGFRILLDWYRAQPLGLPASLVEPSKRLLPASSWTAWVALRPAIIIRQGRMDHSTPGWKVLNEAREAIERVCKSVGQVEIIMGPEGPHSRATGFMVAEDVVMTASFAVGDVVQRQEDGRWAFSPETRMHIDFSEDPGNTSSLQFDITEVLSIHHESYVALLRVSSTSSQGGSLPAPLSIASEEPTFIDGRALYVVGYPGGGSDFIDSSLVAQVFGDVFGVKRLLPGELLAVDEQEGILFHDCFTLPGTAGGCVVDLETHLVLGLHNGAAMTHQTTGGYKYNNATALWMLVNRSLW
jgi:hypothetical protein